MQTVRIEYYGMDGEGRTVTEAKQDAGRKITRALSGSYTPEIIKLGEYAALIYREPQGWAERLIEGPEGVTVGMVYGSVEGDREEATRYARRNLAQLAYRSVNIDEALAFVHKDDREQVRRYFAWQDEMRRALDEGCTDEEARERAFRIQV